MASVDRDLVRLHRVLRILQLERLSSAARIESLYDYLFEDEELKRFGFMISQPKDWSEQDLERLLGFATEILVAYVAEYRDPNVIPVTYYKRQRRVAAHLDRHLRMILREAVRRWSKDPYLEESGAPVPDLFLDEPIFFMKQEARAKGFPRTKKGGGASRRAIRERFELKLQSKGYGHASSLQRFA